MFGNWIHNPSTDIYLKAEPFEHVIIENFFTDEFCETITLPDPDETWYKYDNPFEGKFLTDKLKGSSNVIVEALYSQSFLNFVRKLTGIDNLEPDPHLNAGGIHAYGRNGRAGAHLDYTIHPLTGKERRVSIMVYLTKDWDPAWGGKLSLWDENLENRKTLECSLWNTAVIFRTNGMAYHGFPEPITCPEGKWRKVIGVYYMSEPTQETLAAPRKNAVYFPLPGSNPCEQLVKLYEIRKTRRVTATDLEDWPTWRQDCGLKV
jgi:hypothetical protein